MAVGADLDRRAALTGAGVTLAIVLPVAIVARAARSTADLAGLVVVAVLVGFFTGGAVAGGRAPHAPFVHAAAAAALAFGVSALVTIIRRFAAGTGLSLAVAVNLLLYLQLSVGLALLGALATRGRAVRRGERGGEAA